MKFMQNLTVGYVPYPGRPRRGPMQEKAALWRVFVQGVLLLALFAASGTVQAQAPQQEPLQEVTAAIPGHFPPQYVLTEDGELSGFAVDVAERVAALAGIRFTYLIEENWQAATDAMRSGRALQQGALALGPRPDRLGQQVQGLGRGHEPPAVGEAVVGQLDRSYRTVLVLSEPCAAARCGLFNPS